MRARSHSISWGVLIDKETAQYLRDKHLRVISPFHDHIKREYTKLQSGEGEQEDKFRGVVQDAMERRRSSHKRVGT